MKAIRRELPDRHRQIISVAAAYGYSASYSMMTQCWRLRDPADCPVLREGAPALLPTRFSGSSPTRDPTSEIVMQMSALAQAGPRRYLGVDLGFCSVRLGEAKATPRRFASLRE